MTQDEIVSAAVSVAFILRDASNNDRTHVSQIAATLLAKSDESRASEECLKQQVQQVQAHKAYYCQQNSNQGVGRG